MKKIVIILLFSLFLNNVVYSQCSNPDCGDDFSVCGMSANLSVENVTTGHWSAVIDGEPTLANFFPDNASPDVIAVIPYFPEHHSSVDFVWTDDSGPCSDTVNVIFAKMPIAGVGETQFAEVCGNVFYLNADTTGNGWAEFAWYSPFVPASFSEFNLPDSEVEVGTAAFGDSAHVTATFVWTVSNYACVARDTMWVTFYQRPVAFAGEDVAVCGNQYSLQAELSIPESQNYTPLMQWGIAGHPSGESADISSVNAAQTNLTVSSDGLWEVTLTERNSLLSYCYSRDTAIIEFVEIPVVNAGPDKNVCGNCVTLDGISGGFGGSWLPNGSTFEDYYLGNTEVCVASYGSRTFTWLETNSATTSSLHCSEMDEVEITFWQKPNAAIFSDLIDTVVCGLNYEDVLTQNPANGESGYWICPTCGEDWGYILQVVTDLEVDSSGFYDFYWVLSTGPMLTPGFCADTAGPLTIHFLDENPINAGIDRDVFGFETQLEGSSICETDPFTNCNYLWVTYGAIVEDVNSLQTSVSVSEYGEYTFILVSEYENMQGCTDNDTVKINFRDPIEFGVNQTEKYDFEIFPNPTSGLFTLQTEHRVESIIITDINGKQVLKIDYPSSEIDISRFENGFYFLQIETLEGVATSKIVKQ